MSFKEQLGLVYLILPHIHLVKNKIGLILSILIGSSEYTIKLENNISIKFKSSEFSVLQSLLGVITYSTSYSINSKKELKITFDEKNYVLIPLNKLTYEDQNLLELLFLGTKYGVDFITDESIPLENFRDKTIRIIKINDKKIVEISNGVKFFLDSIHVGNTIIETFVKDIHRINSNNDWKDKIIIDVGAECGDTPLYFASKGANVYAFEPVKTHFEAMLRNISLNPHLSDRIIPINAAIGKDGSLKFYESMKIGGGGGASFLYNNQGNDFKISEVIGYSLESALEKFNIKNIDLLKMDCKGCEFLLTENALKNINKVKIEYSIHSNEHKIENLTRILENCRFSLTIYRVGDQSRRSNRFSANIYGVKIQN